MESDFINTPVISAVKNTGTLGRYLKIKKLALPHFRKTGTTDVSGQPGTDETFHRRNKTEKRGSDLPELRTEILQI